MRSPGLDALICDGAVMACEAQAHLTALHGSSKTYSFDFPQSRFSFSEPNPGTYSLQLLGSAAQGPRTWLWAWANTQVPEHLTQASRATRDLGARYGIPELTSEEVPFSIEPETEWEPGMRLSSWLSIAARVASGTWFAYSADYGHGTRGWMLLGGLTLPPPTVAATYDAINGALEGYQPTDHLRLLTSYSALRQIPIEGTTLTLPEGQITATLDDQGRIVELYSKELLSRPPFPDRAPPE